MRVFGPNSIRTTRIRSPKNSLAIASSEASVCSERIFHYCGHFTFCEEQQNKQTRTHTGDDGIFGIT